MQIYLLIYIINERNVSFCKANLIQVHAHETNHRQTTRVKQEVAGRNETGVQCCKVPLSLPNDQFEGQGENEFDSYSIKK